MPTGYTAIIDDNPSVTFEQFLWRCTRAMGACVMMRDDPFDTPIPESFQPSDYYPNRIAEMQAERDKVALLTDEECDVEARKAFDEEQSANTSYAVERTTSSDRYDAMQKAVEGWEPPTPDHQGLKDFMLEQLNTGRPYSYTPSQSKLLSGVEWKQEKLQRLDENIRDCTAENEREIQRTNERNEWLKQLRESVPPPVKMATA